MTQYSAYEVIVDALRDLGKEVKDSGQHKAMAQCPAHDDNSPSLSVGLRMDGAGAILKCHAGCTHTDVLDALKLTQRDLFDDAGMRDAFNPTKTYVYNGGRKNHRNPRPDGGKTFWQEGSEDHSLYAVEHIGSATTVYVCEGEKGADVVRQIGATAVATGGSERTCDLNPLVGREVVLIADRDKSGAKWARRLTNELTTVETTSVRVVQAAVDIAKADVVEHITAGYTLDELEPFPGLPADDAGLPGGGSTDGADEKPPKRSQASQLVDMARDVSNSGSATPTTRSVCTATCPTLRCSCAAANWSAGRVGAGLLRQA